MLVIRGKRKDTIIDTLPEGQTCYIVTSSFSMYNHTTILAVKCNVVGCRVTVNMHNEDYMVVYTLESVYGGGRLQRLSDEVFLSEEEAKQKAKEWAKERGVEYKDG